MSRFKPLLRWVLGVMFATAGVNHFLNPGFYLLIMPPYLPWHRELVIASGVLEVVLGVLLLVPRTSASAAWWLIALLVAVFPANLHMALHPELFPEFSTVILYVRLPLQGAFIAWAYWFTCDPDLRKSRTRES